MDLGEPERSGARTGIRSWISASWRLASVLMVATVCSNGPPATSTCPRRPQRQRAHRRRARRPMAACHLGHRATWLVPYSTSVPGSAMG
jgi:hypothetical protein